jgi:uncharacterized membrane protein
MSSSKRKITDRLLDISVEKAIALIAVFSGLSVASFAAFAKEIWARHFFISIGGVILFVMAELVLILVIWLIYHKRKEKRLFEEGTKVKLSTGNSPVMSAGRYNFINNKVHCTWSHDKEVKSQWINQNQLAEYIPAESKTVIRRSDFWNDRNRY